eukprot:12925432-Prorocentrum_lima.AAC.1
MKTFQDKSFEDLAERMDSIGQDSRLHKLVERVVEALRLRCAILKSKVGRRESAGGASLQRSQLSATDGCVVDAR